MGHLHVWLGYALRTRRDDNDARGWLGVVCRVDAEFSFFDFNDDHYGYINHNDDHDYRLNKHTVVDSRFVYVHDDCFNHSNSLIIVNYDSRRWWHEVVWWSSDTSHSHQFLFLDSE